MTTIEVNNNVNWDSKTRTFSINERHVAFATRYKLINPKTQNCAEFELSHSTGREFDPATKWIYKCVTDSELILQVCNDAAMTHIAAQNYLRAKMQNM